MGQNPSKVEALIKVKKICENKKLIIDKVHTCKISARMVGPHLHYLNMTHIERPRGIKDAVRNFHMFGKFWYVCRDLQLIFFFKCIFVNTLLSGLVGFVLREIGNKVLNRVLCEYGRKALAGLAIVKTCTSAGGTKYVSLSNEQVQEN